MQREAAERIGAASLANSAGQRAATCSRAHGRPASRHSMRSYSLFAQLNLGQPLVSDCVQEQTLPPLAQLGHDVEVT